MSVGYIVGSFDLLNIVDLDLLAQARAQCSRLIVGVYPDEVVTDTFGRPPVMPLSERMTLLDHLRTVDEVIVHGTPGAIPDSDVVRFSVGDQAFFDEEPTVQLTSLRRSRSTLPGDRSISDSHEAVA